MDENGGCLAFKLNSTGFTLSASGRQESTAEAEELLLLLYGLLGLRTRDSVYLRPRADYHVVPKPLCRL